MSIRPMSWCCTACLPNIPPSHATCLSENLLSQGTHLSNKLPCRATCLFDKPLSRVAPPSDKKMGCSLYLFDKLQSHTLICPTSPPAMPHVYPANWQAAAAITIIEKLIIRLDLQVRIYRTTYFTHQHVAQHTSQPTPHMTHYNLI